MITIIKIILNRYQVAMRVSRGVQTVDTHKLNIM